MTKKQILTDREIEKDIATAIKHPAEMAEHAYRKWDVVVILSTCGLFVFGIVRYEKFLWVMLGMIAFGVGVAILQYFDRRRRTRRVSICDYEISVEILHSKEYEHYIQRTGTGRRRRSRPIDNYTWRFENGQVWRIPQKIYLWNDRYSMARERVHEMIHRGDSFIVVTKKESGDVVAAYPTEIFEYRKESVDE